MRIGPPDPRPSKLSPTDSKKQGFAVIIALSLMSFIVLLLLSMTTLVQVETRTAEINKQRLLARQNALLGAYIALGDLQKYAGPDTRVTATSSIEDSDFNTAVIDSVPSGRHHWTGVWHSNPPANPATLFEAGNPVWLISGADQASTDPLNATFVEQKTIVSRGTLGQSATASDEVTVGLEPIVDNSNSEVGNFAWWVADEGVKASLFLSEPEYYATAAASEEERLSMARRSGFFATDSGYATLEQDTVAKRDFTRKATSRSSLRLEPTGTITSPLAQEIYHDATANSISLLTDTQNGGLREDLSYFFENGSPSNAPSGAILAGNPLLSASLGANISPWDRITWEQLQDYHNLYQTNGTIDIRPQTINQAGIYPLIQQARVFFSVTCSRATPTDYNFHFHVHPLVVLANPYDRTIQASDLRLKFNFVSGGNLELRTQSAANSGAGPFAATSFRNLLDNIQLGISSVTLDPGEAKVYSLTFEPSNDGRYVGDPSYHYNDNPNLSNELFPLSEGYDDLVSIRRTHSSSIPATTVENATGTNIHGLVLYYPGGEFWATLEDSNGAILNQFGPIGYPEQSESRGSLGGWPTLSLPLTAADTGARTIGIHLVASTAQTPDLIPFTTFNDFKNGWLTDYNIRAPHQGRLASFPGIPTGYLHVYDSGQSDLFNRGFGSNLDLAGDDIRMPWGPGLDLNNSANSAPFKTLNTVLFTTPQAPISSIAQLQHFNASGYLPSSWDFYDTEDDVKGRTLSATNAYAVGNAYANPFVSRDNTVRRPNQNETFIDLSYALNDTLYDHYFFSTIPQSGAVNFEQLINTRLTPVSQGNASDDNLRDSPTAAAEHLGISGGFNINSTSVKAWTALLNSFANIEYKGETDLSGIFPRTLHSPGARVDEANQNGEELESWSGYRHLTGDEIFNENEPTDLAREIVKEIKKRGPFLSFSDFVNRELANTEEGLTGPLQAALDRTVNRGFSPNYDIDISSSRTRTSHAADPAHFGNGSLSLGSGDSTQQTSAAGSPGWVLQADILQALGPILTSRSDTFTIRAYGSSFDEITPDKAVEAYCEITVQRIPEFVDSSQSPDTEIGLSPTNINFGRRFKVTNIRWIGETEI